LRQALFRIASAAAFAAAFGPSLAAARAQIEDEAEDIGLDLKRSPEAQARAAIRKGDFRVARTVYNETDSNGHIGFGQDAPGLACDGNLGEVSARDLAWGKAARRFAEAYNAALLADPRYPDRDVCVAVDGDARQARWPDFSSSRGRPLNPASSVNRAARAARPDLIRAQVAAGRPFDSYDRWYRRPLHWAARRGDLESLDLLLGAGARTDGSEPASALLLAVDSGHSAAAERLLAAGASPFRCGEIDVRLSWGNTLSPGRRACPLAQAIERGFAAAVEPLVRSALARGDYYKRRNLIEDLLKGVDLGRTGSVQAFVEGTGEQRARYLQPSILRMAAYRLNRPMLTALLSLGGGWAARTPAEERLWLAAARLRRPEPLAMLIWFGRDLNYLPAQERRRLEAQLPKLTAAKLRPFLQRADEAREKVWDAVLAGDLPALDAMAAAGVDFAERRGDTALSRAAGRDSATVRWVLAHGGRTDTYEDSDLSLGCSDVSDDFGRNKHSRAQRESFIALCDEEEQRAPKQRPGQGFSEHALVTAVHSGDAARIDLLLPGSTPEAALDAVQALVAAPATRADRKALLTRLSALAALGFRSELASTLSDSLERKDLAAAAAILAGFTPTAGDELRYALDTGSDKAGECRLDDFRFVREHGVDLSAWRDSGGGNLFHRAAACESPDFIAFAASVPGLGVNDLDDYGRTPLQSLPWDKREGTPAAKAMAALGARSCRDLYGDESDKCGSPGIKPDPAL
jgi:hypothetical protein